MLATLATERTDGLIAEGDSAASALNAGYHLAYLIGAGLVGVAVVVTLVMLRPAGRQQEHALELGGAEPAYAEAG